MKTTITEIKTFLAATGSTLRKANLMLNGNTSYEVNHRDGGFKLLTVQQLKEAYVDGVL